MKNTILFLSAICFIFVNLCHAEIENSDHWREPWSAYELIRQSSFVIVGDIGIEKRDALGSNVSAFRLFKVKLKQSIYDPQLYGEKEIYLIAKGPAYGGNVPPVLSSKEYLLFLHPVTEESWKAIAEKAKSISLSRENIYEIVGLWQGAVSMDKQYRDIANDEIKRQFKVEDAKEILKSTEFIYSNLKKIDAEKGVGKDFLEGKSNGIISEFKKDFSPKPFFLKK